MVRRIFNRFLPPSTDVSSSGSSGRQHVDKMQDIWKKLDVHRPYYNATVQAPENCYSLALSLGLPTKWLEAHESDSGENDLHLRLKDTHLKAVSLYFRVLHSSHKTALTAFHDVGRSHVHNDATAKPLAKELEPDVTI